MTNKGLDPVSGKLRMRLDSSLPHLCVPVDEGRRGVVCQLHRWAFRRSLESAGMKDEPTDVPPGAKKKVVRCKTCGINLCVRCWEIFHKEKDMEVVVYNILGAK